ncbi:MAG: TonB-dependent receptor [Gammaproteobacteria bacterium]|nr:TonB-dependent receptor [Gammaproteobacteria bacterium]
MQLAWKAVADYLTVTGGLRYDHNGIYGRQLSGRIGIVSNPFHDIVVLKVLYGNAFEAPSPQLLFGVPFRPGDILGNPDLKPQRVHTIEGQLSYKIADYFLIMTSLAYNYLQDKAEFIQQGLNRMAQNVAQASSLSWETELRGNYRELVGAYMSFEWVMMRSDRGADHTTYFSLLVGSENVIYPSHMLRFGVYGSVPSIPLQLSVEGVYVGPRRASEMNMLELGASYELQPYFLLGATLSTKRLELIDDRETRVSLSGRNLLGIEGPDPGYAGVDYPLAPLTIFVQLTQQL